MVNNGGWTCTACMRTFSSTLTTISFASMVLRVQGWCLATHPNLQKCEVCFTLNDMLSTNVKDWSVDDVCAWVRDLGFGSLEPAFRDNAGNSCFFCSQASLSFNLENR